MDFENYKLPLEVLDPNEILGNGVPSNSNIPVDSDNFKLPISSRKRGSVSSVARTLSLTRSPRPTSKPRARLVSETDISPTHQEPKLPKMSEMSEVKFTELLAAALDKQSKELNATIETQSVDLKQNLADMENTLGNRMLVMRDDIKEIKTKQQTETDERESLSTKVDILSQQVSELTTRLEKAEKASDVKEIVEQVSSKFSKEINTTHFKNLVNEIKETESSLMIFGYKPQGGPDLGADVYQNILVDKLGINSQVYFQAEKIGEGDSSKNREAPIKLNFQTFIARNQILKMGFKLPRGLKMEKCMPREYRNKNKELLHLGWQLKSALKNGIKTRVIFQEHLLCLQVKKKDEGALKYDWTIQKEWFPPQRVSGVKSEAARNRLGLTPSPEIQEKDRHFVIFTDLTPSTDDNQVMLDYFLKSYVDTAHNKHIKDTVDYTSRGMIMVKVMSQEICDFWLEHYSAKEFNGVVPKIQLIK